MMLKLSEDEMIWMRRVLCVATWKESHRILAERIDRLGPPPTPDRRSQFPTDDEMEYEFKKERIFSLHRVVDRERVNLILKDRENKLLQIPSCMATAKANLEDEKRGQSRMFL